MPLYEYQCDACATRFERIQKFSDPPLQFCPTCGGQVKKLLSSPAIQFKGSGWYITDYAKKGPSGKDKDKDSGDGAGKAQPADSSSSSDTGSSGTAESTSTGSGSSSTTPAAAAKTD